MLEVQGDIFDFVGDAICVLVNLDVRRDGDAVMGRGQAFEAAKRWPCLPRLWGEALAAGARLPCRVTQQDDMGPVLLSKTGPLLMPCHIICFPTKRTWRASSSLDIIRQSTMELVRLTDEHGWKRVGLPRPGCGNGSLVWADVRPILGLDDRFVIVDRRT